MFSQTKSENHETAFDSLIHKKIYRIEYGTIQKVELIEMINGDFKGSLTNILTQYRRKRDKEFVQIIKIQDSIVKRLMKNLKNLDIETLECPNFLSPDYDCGSALDDVGTTFIILSSQINKENTFGALSLGGEKKSYESGKQFKAQKILNLINSEVHFKKTLDDFIRHLPAGTYGYYGVNMIKIGQ